MANEPSGFTSVVDRFGEVAPNEFEQELERRWDAIEAIKGNLTPAVVEEVRKGTITPIEGLGIYSCLTAQLLGYAQFHGAATGADMLSALVPNTRDRQLAHS